MKRITRNNTINISNGNEKIVFIVVLIFFVFGFGFMYWGYAAVAHPKKLPLCERVNEGATFHSISPQIITEKTFFHRFYKIEPHRGSYCIDGGVQKIQEGGEK